MSVQVRYAAFSDVGLVRQNNQDGGYASQNLLVLADGMGGAAAGDIASSVTIAHLASVDEDVPQADDMLPLLREAVENAHTELLIRAKEDSKLEGLGTTCTAILRSDNKLAMVHIGDSRAYVLHDKKLVQVTRDHTLVQYLVDKGELTPEEAEIHPKRNVIMRALGDFPGEVELDESVREAIVGDRWLLCSDGLSGYVSFETIEETLRDVENIEECGERLISFALAAGAPDNVTIVLADIIDDSQLLDGFSPQKPIVVGSAAVDFMRPTRGGDTPAAKAAALTSSLRDTDSEPETKNEIVYPEPQRNWGARVGVIIGIIALLAFGAFGTYKWTQDQYYVSSSNGKVVIYQGVPTKIGPLKLSHIVETSDIVVDNLAPQARDRLKTPITRTSLNDARVVVESMRAYVTTPANGENVTDDKGIFPDSETQEGSTSNTDSSTNTPTNNDSSAVENAFSQIREARK